MKKVFMLMAFAAFFSMAATSCAGGDEAEGENTEAEAGDDAAEEEGGEH